MPEVTPPKYTVSDKTREQFENNFTYHRPLSDQPARYEAIREKVKELAYVIAENTPPSREQSVALTNLETACFWANAAIARIETE